MSPASQLLLPSGKEKLGELGLCSSSLCILYLHSTAPVLSLERSHRFAVTHCSFSQWISTFGCTARILFLVTSECQRVGVAAQPALATRFTCERRKLGHASLLLMAEFLLALTEVSTLFCASQQLFRCVPSPMEFALCPVFCCVLVRCSVLSHRTLCPPLLFMCSLPRVHVLPCFVSCYSFRICLQRVASSRLQSDYSRGEPGLCVCIGKRIMVFMGYTLEDVE